MKIGLDMPVPQPYPFISRVYSASTTESPSQTVLLDSLEISSESADKAQKIRRQLEKTQAEIDMLNQQLDAAQQQGDALANEMNLRLKCLMIAMRILKGDEVPKEDHAFLAKHDLDLYARAVSMRRMKERPEKHKRLSNEEPDTVSNPDFLSSRQKAVDGEPLTIDNGF